MHREKKIIVYFANWNLKKKSAERAGEVAGIPWGKVDFINHAFWEVYPVGSNETTFDIKVAKKAARTSFSIRSMKDDFDLGDMGTSALDPSLPASHFGQYEILHKKYPDTVIMISIGGWARCGYFSEMAYTKEGRASFIKACIDLMKKHDFIGGIDIDWEYPGCSTAGERLPDPSDPDMDQGCPIFGTPSEDSENFTLLLTEMREAFDKAFPDDRKYITACCAAAVESILQVQDWKNIAKHLDYLNVMTYDMAGVWSGKTGHHSPLSGAKSAVEYLNSLGLDSSMLNIGTPFYAMVFEAKEIVRDHMDDCECIPSRPTSEVFDSEILNEFEKLALNNKDGWNLIYNEEAGGAALYNDSPSSPYYKWFFSYENSKSLGAKIDYLNASSLAGIIVWEISQDTVNFDRIRQMDEALK